MTPQEYYSRVLTRLKNSYQFYDYVIAAGNELCEEGYDPAFPVLAAGLDQLETFTRQRGLQVHLPVVGARSQSVLMPFDFEIFLGGENHLLYTDKQTQKGYFAQILPVCRYIEDLFRSRAIPYLLDYTPSGGHFLFQNVLGDRATQALLEIGYLEEDLIKACNYIDQNDIRRRHGISLDAARVFSGLGKIAEYISLLTMEAFRNNASKGLLPVTISDSLERCINLDNTWSEGSPFMRSIRSPFSLHKKNQEKYGKFHQPPLVDVIGTHFDGRSVDEEADLDVILDCMWDLGKAAVHAQRFTGRIPRSNDTLIDFVAEYQRSDLFAFHQDFDNQSEIPKGMALVYAREETNIPDWTRHIIEHPNPAALQPQNMIGFVYDFLIRANWQPKHIAGIFRDLYQNPAYHWTQDFFKYPAQAKANYWARVYSALALWNTGRLNMAA